MQYTRKLKISSSVIEASALADTFLIPYGFTLSEKSESRVVFSRKMDFSIIYALLNPIVGVSEVCIHSDGQHLLVDTCIDNAKWNAIAYPLPLIIVSIIPAISGAPYQSPIWLSLAIVLSIAIVRLVSLAKREINKLADEIVLRSQPSN